MEVRTLSGKYQIIGTLLVSLALIGYGGYGVMSQSSALSGSIMVNGIIQSADVVEVDSRRGVDYSPDVAYNYSVDGSNYVSTNIYPGGMTPSFDSREKADLGLEEGQTVTVYLVDVNSPESSFLRHERSRTPFIIGGIGLLMFVLTSYSVYSNRLRILLANN